MTLYDQKFATAAPKKAPPRIQAPQSPSPAPAPPQNAVAHRNANRAVFAYWALLSFSFLYYARPEDFIPGMLYIPVGKISGGIALAGLIVSWGRLRAKMPLEIKLVLLLFLHMCLTVPFAFWRGGAFQVVRDDFSKAAIVAVLISMIVTTLIDLRRLLWVQAASVAVLTVASIIVHPASPGGGTTRLWGLGGVFSNPNDFAINIAINFPLCLAFFLGSKGILKKLTWSVALLFLLYGVIATYSRSGLIAMVICSVICVWEFGIKGKRPMVIVAAVGVLLAGVGVAVTTPRYLIRLSTLISGENEAGSMDHGSLDARRELLMESIRVSFQHPLLGVGPGNFQAYTESWHVTHNTYTELSSEAGLPALALFLTILFLTFRNLGNVRKTAGYQTNPQMQLFSSALRAGTAAYIVGAAFASSAYNLFPYFMVAYASVLYKIATSEQPQETSPVGTSLNSRNAKNPYGKQEQHALAGAR